VCCGVRLYFAGWCAGWRADVGQFDGYAPLVAEIIRFFQTGVAPIQAEETIEIFAFLEASAESKRLGGKPVSLSDVLARAVAPNTLTEAERLVGWQLLWDGQTTTGWRGAGSEILPDEQLENCRRHLDGSRGRAVRRLESPATS
jgi:hypothetical protein